MRPSELVNAGEGLSASGAVLSAFGAAGSWFCCLPFVLGGLGAGSAGLAAVLAPVRPFAFTLSVLLLGVAFFQAYRRGDSSDAGQRVSRRNVRLRVWVAAVAAAVLLSVPLWLNWVIYWSL